MTEPNFNNIAELKVYLKALEARLKELEEKPGNDLPKTNLLSKSLVTRAFAVYGHTILATMIIGTISAVIFGCCYLILFSTIFGTLISQLIQINPPK